MKNTRSFIIRIVAIAGFTVGGFALAVLATTLTNPNDPWTSNSGAPTNNAPTPINVGSVDQEKLGWLGLVDLLASNSFVYASGTPADNRVLVSETVNGQPGVGVWETLAPTCFVQ